MFSKIKKLPIIRLFYNLPGASSAYHFLWAWSGAQFHRHPSKKIFVIGITGTKGKTTTLELLNTILESAGKKTALLSSLHIKTGSRDKKNPTGNSMPGHGYIQKFLREAIRDGCQYALIEVTSQGVAMHRHRFIDWGIGAITNLSPEHIEAHGSFENYRAAKLAFLEYVIQRGGTIFLNRDDKHFDFFAEALLAGEPVRYSKEDEVIGGLLKNSKHGKAEHQTFLMSEFNAQNVAAAAAIAKKIGIGEDAIEKAILEFAGVPGRMQFVKTGPYTAVVDYAHTPDSLEAAYKALKTEVLGSHGESNSERKLICLLGAAGGGRDKWKRSAMGAVAAKYCDEVILTDEDPYDEDPEEIVNEIKRGLLAANFPGERIKVVMDRREAIREAVAMLREGDIAIGTGKGSEDWIHLKNGKRIPWNEREVFEEELQRKDERERPVGD